MSVENVPDTIFSGEGDSRYNACVNWSSDPAHG